MKSAIFALLLCCLVYVAYSNDAPAGAYPTKFDNINLDEILGNKKLLTFYVQCLTDKKTCNSEGQTLKDVLGDALKTKCSKCNPKQRDGAYKAINKLESDYPEEFKLLLDKWDPTGEYIKAFKVEQQAYQKSKQQ